ncbi:MAG TPA: NfeD family protein [Kiritimatiellia bacterium]|jgi:membrane-bound serine protease (ClpP class)|nr:nodulation protein NfeD [Kiritimatiellia bacterium]OQC59925.1 MAG: hypothetical protein BWX54_00432 [Verrucomicrobia bacterium ADurb.Bin018]HOE00226.1 NfeD family protein [Kiritimatiellia bacterium]HOE37138.1 NfeD family protein [Kiritimatiellia bacterium]HOR74481.1 NfeD family protein [Kiritimatiellia bacterium]
MKTRLALLALLLLSFVAIPTAPAATPPANAPVYVIPVHGQIEGALLYVLRRGLAEATAQQAAAVILTMDTPGGTLAAASDIVRTIQASPIPVYTYVEKDAFSAGAIIALATKKIYMAPGSVIGDALPIMMSPFGGVQEMSGGIEEKAVSAVSALIRAAAQDAGHDPELAEKMVRRENEFKIGDEVICPAGRLLTLTADEAAKPGRDGRSLLSAGTAPTLADVLAQLELTGHPQVAMQITAAEKVARLIAAAAPILMILGFLGIYIEIKTPGFGLPGILGAICLALFFWGHHIAGLAGMEDLVIFIAGCVLVLVEIFLIPGFGFTGVLGLALIFISLLGAMVRLAPGGPWLPAWPDVQIPLVKLLGSIVGAGAGALLLGRFLPRSPLFGKLTLGAATSAAEGYTAAPDTSALVGQTGVTLNLLRPAGTARFGDDRLDVTTSGEFIPAGTPVQIVEARGSRIVVQKIG